MLIRRHQEIYDNTLEMNQLYMVMVILLIFLLTIMAVVHSNLNSK